VTISTRLVDRHVPVGDVWRAFLKLGVTSFGGPVAHLGYFRRELVEKRGWIDEARFAHLLALCQLLPGPASSQLGFALGMVRAGWRGAFAAFIAFTLPSALLMSAFATVLPALDQPIGQAGIHGLKLLAVAVVGHAVVTMARKLTADVPRAAIGLAAGAFVLVSGSAISQLIAVVIGGALGLLLCRNVAAGQAASFDLPYGERAGIGLLVVFSVLLGLAISVTFFSARLLSVAAAFYRTGSLVFGGGHVVLPLLQEAVVTPGWVSTDEFLGGYGAAQALPGPLFAISAFLGARLEHGEGGLLGATVALIAIFLPGFLLLAGALPLWRRLVTQPAAFRAIAGVNAAVVGLLAAAFYDPVWTSAVTDWVDVGVALLGFAALMTSRVPVLIVVVWCVAATVLRG
jgi:chromate transporter